MLKNNLEDNNENMEEKMDDDDFINSISAEFLQADREKIKKEFLENILTEAGREWFNKWILEEKYTEDQVAFLIYFNSLPNEKKNRLHGITFKRGTKSFLGIGLHKFGGMVGVLILYKLNNPEYFKHLPKK
ncbi:MAG: hypothetical protein ABIA91_01770 [Patescibacteria group bacterium]